MVCSIFIASSTSSGAPFSTGAPTAREQRDHLARHRRLQARALFLVFGAGRRRADRRRRDATRGRRRTRGALALRDDRRARRCARRASPRRRRRRAAWPMRRPPASPSRRASASDQRPPSTRGRVDLARRLADAKARAARARGRSGASRRGAPRRIGDRRARGVARDAAASRSTSASAATSHHVVAAASPAAGNSTACSRSISAGVEIGVRERRRRDQPAEELDVVGHADDAVLRERVAHARAAPRRRSRAVHDQLGDHRVVERRDRVALLDAGVDAHVRAIARGGARWTSLPVDGRKPRSGSSA